MLGQRFFVFYILAVLASVTGAVGQTTVSDVLGNADLSDPGQRAQAVARIRTILDTKRSAARIRAAQLGMPLRATSANGRVVEMVDFNGSKPVYLTTHNVNAAISTGANLLQAAPYLMDGTGLTVGEWDAGSARSTHQEFGGRITVMDGAAAADHSTHVGGTIAAAGIVAAAKGMAPAIHIDSYEWTSDKTEMTGRGASYPGESGKISLSNHSYGLISGWNYTGLSSPRWTWYGTGTTAAGVETDFGKYDTNTNATDILAFNLPYYLIVRSAGNERLDNPAAGEPVSLTTSTTSAVTYNPASHPAGDGVYRSGGYDTISADALAKNILTVGSVGDAVSGAVRQPSNAAMSSYSSWGPTDDGRIKPDVVANGEAVYSSLATSDTAYGIYSGTSMASPSATGSAALLVQWWSHLLPGHAMRASTLKALLIHAADDLGAPGPDYQYGWGLVNVKAAADLIQAYKNSPGIRSMIEDRVTTTVASRSYTFTWDGVSPIRATLCWTDPAGAATTFGDLRTARLVNDLDLRINGPTGTVYQPWVMPFVGDWTAAKLSAAAAAGANHTDNVEQVVVASPTNPGLYTATVTFTGALTNSAQNFSIIISGGAAAATAPAITGLTPGTSTLSGTMAISMTGSGFLLGANVRLTKAGQPDVVATGQEIIGDTAKFRVNVEGLAQGLWNVVLTNPDGRTVTLPNGFSVPGPLWSENLETGAAGWTHSALTGSDNWALSKTFSRSSATSFFASGPNTKNDNVLISPAIAIPAGSSGLRLSFWHRYAFQSSRDGGVLEFSLDNGVSWFDVTAPGSGAAFATGAYSSTISTSSSTINGRKAWSGTLSTFTQVAVDLTDSAKYAGKSLRIRWRLATNTGTASAGWYVDDIGITGVVPAANLAPSIVMETSATPGTVTGFTTLLSVAASDDAGEPALTYTWSASGGSMQRPVSFDSNGTNAAKSTTATFAVAGTYDFTVTVRDAEGLTATGAVSVTVNQNPTSLAVSPAIATLPAGTSQLFTAEVNDQFGDPLLTQPPVSWITSGGGAIDANGLFTATAAGGPFSIGATSGALNGTAALTVSKGTATVSLTGLIRSYDGDPKPVGATTSPLGLPLMITYDGGATAPSSVGNHAVVATINDSNYEGGTSATLRITGETLATWQARNFTQSEIDTGLALENADRDGDGLCNLAEYALGTDPQIQNGMPAAVFDASGLTLTFTRPNDLPDVTCAAESSDDLILWNPLPVELVADGNVQTMRVCDPLTTGDPARRFLRLRFTR